MFPSLLWFYHHFHVCAALSQYRLTTFFRSFVNFFRRQKYYKACMVSTQIPYEWFSPQSPWPLVVDTSCFPPLSL